MHTRLVTSTATPTSIRDLMAIDVKHIRGIQLALVSGTVNYGDQAVQAQAVPALSEVLPVNSAKAIYLSGVGTVNVSIFV
jgi:hypothetical protein